MLSLPWHGNTHQLYRHFLFPGFSSLSSPVTVLLLPLTLFLCPLNPGDRTQMVMAVTGLNPGSELKWSNYGNISLHRRGKKAKARAKKQKQRVSPAGKPQHLPKVTETRAGWAEGGVCKSKQQRCPARRQPQVPVTLPALLSRVLTHILSFRL